MPEHVAPCIYSTFVETSVFMETSTKRNQRKHVGRNTFYFESIYSIHFTMPCTNDKKVS